MWSGKGRRVMKSMLVVTAGRNYIVMWANGRVTSLGNGYRKRKNYIDPFKPRLMIVIKISRKIMEKEKKTEVRNYSVRLCILCMYMYKLEYRMLLTQKI